MRFCYALARARELGRVDRDTIGRLLDLVAKGGLDDLRFEGEEGWCVPRRAVAEVAAQGDGKWPPPADELRQLVREGRTRKEMAERYGVTPQAIGYQLRRLGLVQHRRAKGVVVTEGGPGHAAKVLRPEGEVVLAFLREVLARGMVARVQVELVLRVQEAGGS